MRCAVCGEGEEAGSLTQDRTVPAAGDMSCSSEEEQLDVAFV